MREGGRGVRRREGCKDGGREGRGGGVRSGEGRGCEGGKGGEGGCEE